MLKRSLILVLVLAIAVSGCSWLCKNPTDTKSKLQATVDELKAMASTLNTALQQGYDAEIELAYKATTAALATAEQLLEQWCPDQVKVDQAVANADTAVKPQAKKAIKRAKALKFIKE